MPTKIPALKRRVWTKIPARVESRMGQSNKSVTRWHTLNEWMYVHVVEGSVDVVRIFCRCCRYERLSRVGKRKFVWLKWERERERERESKRVCFWERESEKVRKREAEREENLNTENICVYEKSLIGFPWKQVGGKLKKNSRKEKF